ncbi:MAG: thymidine phosphorylase, partial [Rhodospirillaceae bacterium]|nr:thymidine phosphorylase [Rhodospirillaceae bacterium]
MLPQEIIRRKRDGAELTAEEIAAFARGLVDGTFSEGQIAALAMAFFFRGATLAERTALTLGLARSGTTLTWADLDGPVVDKHSSGGIGDAVSLSLAPAVAACGGFVPMISGRGLGHTGGTLDKLDSIPGYRSRPGLDELRRTVRSVGCAIIGQTDDLAPADRRLYAVRDVTATVESVPLITASILSKKIAAGLDALVLDVKCGSGAFMTTPEAARELADSLVAVGNGAGLRTAALVTDMDEPLASVAGNALEVRYAIDHLTGARREPRFHEVTVALGAEMLVLGGLAAEREAARRQVEFAIAGGAAAERFARMVAALGGPGDLLEHPDRHLPRAPVVHVVAPAEEGVVAGIDARAMGLAVVGLGGGRRRVEDRIDPAVGLSDLAGIGA